MNFTKYILLIFILFSCSNRDDNQNEEPENNLVITSFSPTSAVAGDEITFIGEHIDVSKTYSIFFNGVASAEVQNFPSEIKAIIPENATTGQIVIKYDDKSLNVGELEITEEPPLIITSFSPNVASPGDEITFVGENIDPTVIYTVFFNAIEGETTSITETEIVVIVPEGATSGEMTISYENFSLVVGTIEILQELDKLYGYLPIQGGGCEVLNIHNIDINSGILLDRIARIYASSCYSYKKSSFYRGANVFVYTYTTRYAQGMPYGKECMIVDLDSGARFNWPLSDGADYDGTILAAHEGKIYYMYRFYDGIEDIYEVRSANIDRTNVETHYAFSTNFIYDIKDSGVLPISKEVVFFTENEAGQPVFIKLNIETSQLSSVNTQENYSSIFIATDERIFGVKSLGNEQQEILEIDKNTGNVLNSLAVISEMEIINMDYSPSLNSIFALLKDSSSQYLFQLNLSQNISTTTLLDEQNQQGDFEGIYLND